MSDRDVVGLNQLIYRYAEAVDACDIDAFLGVFTPDGRLRTYHPDAEQPFVEMTGHAQLAWIPDRMRKAYRCTAHMMSNPLVTLDGDEATGTVLCTARHLIRDPGDVPTSLNVIIRYVDRYARHGGAWRIADRQIRFLWSERHEVIDSGMGRG